MINRLNYVRSQFAPYTRGTRSLELEESDQEGEPDDGEISRREGVVWAAAAGLGSRYGVPRLSDRCTTTSVPRLSSRRLEGPGRGRETREEDREGRGNDSRGPDRGREDREGERGKREDVRQSVCRGTRGERKGREGGRDRKDQRARRQHPTRVGGV